MKETRKVAQTTQVINEVEQVRLYRLLLNPMHLNKKHKIIVAIAFEKEKLMEWYHNEIDIRSLSFKKGGPLEWFNLLEFTPEKALDNLDLNAITNFEVKDGGPGIDSIWTDDKMIQKFLTECPEVPLLPEDENVPLPITETEGLKIVE